MSQHTDATGLIHLDPAAASKSPPRNRQPNLPSVARMLEAQRLARRVIRTLGAADVETRVLVRQLVEEHFAPTQEAGA